MPKIIDTIRKHAADQGEKPEAERKPFFSFEYYPPRTDDGVANLYSRLGRMARQRE